LTRLWDVDRAEAFLAVVELSSIAASSKFELIDTDEFSS
jgi:hypothetical protein